MVSLRVFRRMETKKEGSKEEETEVEDESSVKEREEEETKKEGDFFRRCRVRVIGLRSGKGSFAKRLILFFLVPEHLKKSLHQVFH